MYVCIHTNEKNNAGFASILSTSSGKKLRTSMPAEAAASLATPSKEKGTHCKVTIVVHAIRATANGSWEETFCESLANVPSVERQLAKARVRLQRILVCVSMCRLCRATGECVCVCQAWRGSWRKHG